jgi:hypothetical protein
MEVMFFLRCLLFLLFFFNNYIVCIHRSHRKHQQRVSINKVAVFNPTLRNLNTITFSLPMLTKPESAIQKVRISDLAETICDCYHRIQDGTLLEINNKENNQKKYCEVNKGIASELVKEDFVTIYSRGFAREPRPINPKNDTVFHRKIINYFLPGFQIKGLPRKGGGALSAYAAVRDNFIHTSCICFDYPDMRQYINFAQTTDFSCLDTIIKNIPDNNKAIYLGTSRGATILLKYELLNTTNRHPSAMILESPCLSLKDVATQLVNTSALKMFLSPYLLYTIFQWLCPHYNSQEDNLTSLLPHINSEVPIFITHLKGDPYISDHAMFTIVHTLAQYNKKVHLLVLIDPTKQATHGRLNVVKAFQKAANAFLKEYDIPHDALLAQEGENLLALAYSNAYVQSPKDWKLTPCFNCLKDFGDLE